jgi:hypothetical protein
VVAAAAPVAAASDRPSVPMPMPADPRPSSARASVRPAHPSLSSHKRPQAAAVALSRVPGALRMLPLASRRTRQYVSRL